MIYTHFVKGNHMHMLSLLLLTCSIIPMLRSAAEDTALTLSEDEQHALHIKNFRSGICGFVSDDCRATHDPVFPPSELTQTCPVETSAWMQKKGFTLQWCCAGAACLTCIPFLASYVTMFCYQGGLYTLETSTASIMTEVCLSTMVPAVGTTVMCMPTRKEEFGPRQDSPACYLDKRIVAWASGRWRETARVSERTSLLETPRSMVMTLDRDEV